MVNNHKLDILFEGLNNIKVPEIDGSYTKYPINAEYRLSKKVNFGILKDMFQCRIQIDNVLLFFEETVLEEKTNIEKAKDSCYDKILTYLMLTRLRTWKESMCEFR